MPRPHNGTAGLEVHAVKLAVDGGRLRELRGHMSRDERARAGRLRAPGAGRRFTAARGSLRELLGARLGVAPGEVELATEANGKPRLARRHGSRLEFSVSHTGERALIAIGDGIDLGVDIERKRRRRRPDFYAGWVRREAYLKARGTGLRVAPDRIELRPRARGEWDVVEDGRPAAGWTVADIAAPPGHYAALAWRRSRC